MVDSFSVENTNWEIGLPIPLEGVGEAFLLIFQEIKREEFLKPSFEGFKKINLFLFFLRRLEKTDSEELLKFQEKRFVRASLFKGVPKIPYYIEEIDYNIKSFQDYTGVYYGSVSADISFKKNIDGLSSAMLKASLEYARRYLDSPEYRAVINSINNFVDEVQTIPDVKQPEVDMRSEPSREDTDHASAPGLLNLPDDDLSHIPSEYEIALQDAKLNLDLLNLLESPKRGPIQSPEIKRLKPVYRKPIDLNSSLERDLINYVESSEPELVGLKDYLSETNGLREKRMSFLSSQPRKHLLSATRKIFRQDDKPSDLSLKPNSEKRSSMVS